MVVGCYSIIWLHSEKNSLNTMEALSCVVEDIVIGVRLETDEERVVHVTLAYYASVVYIVRRRSSLVSTSSSSSSSSCGIDQIRAENSFPLQHLCRSSRGYLSIVTPYMYV